MKKIYIIVVLILFAIVMFFPFYNHTVSSEWEIQFLNKDGSRAEQIQLDHVWKDYSLEWFSDENRDGGLQTDSSGYIRLPKRLIRVSIFQIISSKIRDFLMDLHPHASFGPSSYIICRGTTNCVVSYKNNAGVPQEVVLW